MKHLKHYDWKSYMDKMEELNKAYEEYQEEINRRRREIITKLLTIQSSKNLDITYKKWIDQTIEFIKEEN